MNPQQEERIHVFILECCLRYNIDESHGLKHARSCMKWAALLATSNPWLSLEEARMAIYAAGLHDMCDKKYTEPLEASERIFTWLTEDELWSHEDAEALINIINSMSYSWLKSRAVNGVPVYPEHGKWQRAYHIARHADLLDGYIVGRCFLYGKHVSPSISDEECWKNVKTLFENRVLKYVSDGWIFLPEAITFATLLDTAARRDLKNRNATY